VESFLTGRRIAPVATGIAELGKVILEIISQLFVLRSALAEHDIRNISFLGLLSDIFLFICGQILKLLVVFQLGFIFQ
jgi:hypothetical protein